jgi:tripartite-type tricarboxylate transporter receptor subunit TctC
MKCNPMRMLSLALLAGTQFIGVEARAQAYPSQPIRLVVPFGPGGSPDVIARIVAESLSASLPKPVVIENKPGAGGVVAASSFARSAPDGYNLMLTSEGIYAVVPALNTNLSFNPKSDFQPVIHAARGDMFLAVNAKLGVKTMDEFIAYVKKNPGLNYGSPGKATIHHLGMARIASLAGVAMTHVPYRSVMGALPDLLSNEVSAMFAALPVIAPYLQNGELRALAVGSLQRSSFLPDVPTLSESGFTNFQLPTNVGFVVPAKTSPEIVARLNKEISDALKSPRSISLLPTVGYEPAGGSPEEFQKRMDEDERIYRTLVRETGDNLN